MKHVIGAALLLLVAANLFGSGPVGIYAIVEKVVLEPNELAPERIQVWGAFAFFDDPQQSVSAAKRGYLYFKLPAGATGSTLEAVRREWDLKSVAGTGQAIAFGRWGYTGGFNGLQSDARSSTTTNPPYILSPDAGRPTTDVRVRAETEALNPPATYSTNAGIVKLAAEGNHASIVKQFKDSLKR
jgi:hypothetical protein